jgi:CHAD domain-containing protein
VDPAISLGIGGTLRDLRQAAGELRDLDVLAEHLAKWRLPQPLRQLAARLEADLPARRAVLAERLRQTASSAAMQAMLALLARVIEEQRRPDGAAAVEAKLGELLRKRLRKRRGQMEKAFGRAARKQTDKSLHEARIAVKKLRYALEIAHATHQKGARDALKALKNLQELLGMHHDVSVITETLRQHLAEPGEAEPPTAAARRRRLAAWHSWLRGTQHAQAKRAAEFFLLSYLWRNSSARDAA